MRILITGVSGMLGSSMAVELSKAHQVFGTGNSEMDLPINYCIFDLSKGSYKELIDWSKPELIIHCAALTHGNYCQKNPMEALNVNGYSVSKLLEATDEKVKLIYVSTDAVFSSGIHLAKESDCVFPENVYGKSKELGEFFILNSYRNCLIIRTTIVGMNMYRDKSGFVEWIMNSSQNNEEITLFDDVLFTPISIWDFMEEIKFLITLESFSSKILHISGNEVCTKYEFGMLLLEEFSLNVKKVKKGSINIFTDRAKRSNDQTLDCTFYQEKYNRKLPSLRKTIKTMKKVYNNEKRD
ncbi:SDR family oxidoreductase [Flavivirga rizhaonensis]|uniref:dTDP-4-dehydrorhamnose reductase n=1 Tax=Flavivirga rizhaonensis TaxID=2559571 RepID=A0A4S1E087_9FLAO|nr:SDR family oxidoreductase [Flavivirga rizhaonensis]TGV03849.1 SDR family oxidoreductase [Flavivirga rizhaonensis]